MDDNFQIFLKETKNLIDVIDRQPRGNCSKHSVTGLFVRYSGNHLVTGVVKVR